MNTFTRYFAGLSWEIDDGVRETERTKHCKVLKQEITSEGYGRSAVKVTFVVPETNDSTEPV